MSSIGIETDGNLVPRAEEIPEPHPERDRQLFVVDKMPTKEAVSSFMKNFHSVGMPTIEQPLQLQADSDPDMKPRGQLEHKELQE